MRYNNEPNTIVLLNFEGAALWSKKVSANEYCVYDQHEDIVDVLSETEFFNFLDGALTLPDSDGKNWNFKEEHINAKPSYRCLFNFMSNEINL
jgi:hypothetical protein